MVLSPEHLLLSSVVTIPGCYRKALEAGVRDKYFGSSQNKAVWDWIERFRRQHDSLPSVTALRSTFPDFPLEVDLTEVDYDFALISVEKSYLKRQLTKRVYEIGENLAVDDIDAALSGFTLAGLDIPHQTDGFDPIKDFDVMIEYMESQAEGVTSIPFGFRSFDRRTGGFSQGDLGLIAARTGEGKTYMLVKVAAQALYMGKKVTFFTLEQSRKEIAKRIQPILAHMYGVTVAAATRGVEPDVESYRRMCQELAAQKVGDLRLHDGARNKKYTPSRVSAIVESEEPDLVIVDYTTRLRTNKGRDALEDWSIAGTIASQLLDVAQSVQIPLVAAHQVNRQGDMGPKDRAPRLSTLAQADNFAQDASVVITLRKMGRHCRTFSCEKNRHGDDGFRWYTNYFPERGVIEEVPEDRAYELQAED